MFTLTTCPLPTELLPNSRLHLGLWGFGDQTPTVISQTTHTAYFGQKIYRLNGENLLVRAGKPALGCTSRATESAV